MKAVSLKNVFAVLRPDQSVVQTEVSPTLYQELDSNFDMFRGHVLVSAHEFDSDWGVWERHPAGDEIVLLLSGAASLVWKTALGEQQLELEKPGSYVVIPANTWHTARVKEHASMVFITPGEGTENKENP